MPNALFSHSYKSTLDVINQILRNPDQSFLIHLRKCKTFESLTHIEGKNAKSCMRSHICLYRPFNQNTDNQVERHRGLHSRRQVGRQTDRHTPFSCRIEAALLQTVVFPQSQSDSKCFSVILSDFYIFCIFIGLILLDSLMVIWIAYLNAQCQKSFTRLALVVDHRK